MAQAKICAHVLTIGESSYQGMCPAYCQVSLGAEWNSGSELACVRYKTQKRQALLGVLTLVRDISLHELLEGS
jgi:hypothetical protein